MYFFKKRCVFFANADASYFLRTLGRHSKTTNFLPKSRPRFLVFENRWSYIISVGSFFLGLSIFWTAIMLSWTHVVSNSSSSSPSEIVYFFGICFSYWLYVSFHMVKIWTVKISRNSLVLVSIFSIYLFQDSQDSEVLVSFVSWDLCFHLGNSKIFSWNRILYTLFLTPSALIFCFCGRKLFRNCILGLHCLAVNSSLGTLADPYSIH